MRPTFSITNLAELSDQGTLELSHAIAHRKRQEIASTPEHELSAYADDIHDFGVTLHGLRGTTQQSRLLRLSDAEFWSRKLRCIADEKREHHGAVTGQLGARQDGLQPFCTDASFERFIARKSESTGAWPAPSHSTILREIYKGAGQIYLIAKSLAENARTPDFVSLLITLTCPPIYHPGSKAYKDYSASEANAYICSIYSKLFKHISKKGKAGLDFCGIRGAEPHEDGCPHWHIALYIRKDLVHLVYKKLKAIYDSENGRPQGYFDSHSEKIITTRSSSDPEWFSSISYIMKGAFAWMTGNPHKIAVSLRQKAALSLSGIRQFQLIGTCGRTTKIKAIEKAELHAFNGYKKEKELPSARTERMERTKELLSGLADEYTLERTTYITKYGEIRHKICGISTKDTEHTQVIDDWQDMPSPHLGGVNDNYSRTTMTGVILKQERQGLDISRYIRGGHDPPHHIVTHCFMSKFALLRMDFPEFCMGGNKSMNGDQPPHAPRKPSESSHELPMTT